MAKWHRGYLCERENSNAGVSVIASDPNGNDDNMARHDCCESTTHYTRLGLYADRHSLVFDAMMMALAIVFSGN